MKSRNEAPCSGEGDGTGLQTDASRTQLYEPSFCISSFLEKTEVLRGDTWPL